MRQKILKVGSSAAVIIPKKSLQDLGLAIGSEVSVEIDMQRKVVIVRPIWNIDKELLDWTKNFIQRYRPALEALAKK